MRIFFSSRSTQRVSTRRTERVSTRHKQCADLIKGDLKMKSILTITAVVLGLALTSGVAQAGSFDVRDGFGIHLNP